LNVCCDGVIRAKQYGEKTYCCGTNVYTPTEAICCGKYVRMKYGLPEW
jgi:hypothetical protein